MKSHTFFVLSKPKLKIGRINFRYCSEEKKTGNDIIKYKGKLGRESVPVTYLTLFDHMSFPVPGVTGDFYILYFFST